MEPNAPSFRDLLARVRAGDPRAIELLYAQYSERVLRVVRRALHASLRRRYDSFDFTQSVWGSFFHLPAERFAFATPEEMVAYLSRMAANKVHDAIRGQVGAVEDDVMREQSLDDCPPDLDPLSARLPGNTATPSQFVIAQERWEQLIEGLPPGHVRLMELLRDGYTQTEISNRLGIHPKVIQRLMHRLREAGDRE